MYSPKIAEELIPVLYRMAKARRVPMTVLVNRLLIDALAKENHPEAAQEAIADYAAPSHSAQLNGLRSSARIAVLLGTDKAEQTSEQSPNKA